MLGSLFCYKGGLYLRMRIQGLARRLGADYTGNRLADQFPGHLAARPRSNDLDNSIDIILFQVFSHGNLRSDVGNVKDVLVHPSSATALQHLENYAVWHCRPSLEVSDANGCNPFRQPW